MTIGLVTNFENYRMVKLMLCKFKIGTPGFLIMLNGISGNVIMNRLYWFKLKEHINIGGLKFKFCVKEDQCL
jgi:hypothetical protein